jgi:hypothetical protein
MPPKPKPVSKKGRSQGNKANLSLRGPDGRFLPKPRNPKDIAPQLAEPPAIPAVRVSAAPTPVTPQRETALAIPESPSAPAPPRFATPERLSSKPLLPEESEGAPKPSQVAEIIPAHIIAEGLATVFLQRQSSPIRTATTTSPASSLRHQTSSTAEELQSGKEDSASSSSKDIPRSNESNLYDASLAPAPRMASIIYSKKQWKQDTALII